MGIGAGMIVEGYAAIFERPYFLKWNQGIQEWEIIDRNAFKYCDMTKTVFLFGHAGGPLATVEAGTLLLDVDWYGLHFRADLQATQAGRRLYSDIHDGLIDKASFAFNRNKQADQVTASISRGSRETITTRVKEILFLEDVAAVDHPANKEACVYADSGLFGARVQRELERMQERARQREQIRILASL